MTERDDKYGETFTDADYRDGRRLADYIDMQLSSEAISEPYHLLRLSRRECQFLRDTLRQAQSLPSAEGRGQPWEIAEKCAEICEAMFSNELEAGDVDENFPNNAWSLMCGKAIRAYAATLKGKQDDPERGLGAIAGDLTP